MNIARVNANYERLSRILTEPELCYLEELIPEDDKDREELRALITAARRWRHQYGKSSHEDQG